MIINLLEIHQGYSQRTFARALSKLVGDAIFRVPGEKRYIVRGTSKSAKSPDVPTCHTIGDGTMAQHSREFGAKVPSVKNKVGTMAQQTDTLEGGRLR